MSQHIPIDIIQEMRRIEGMKGYVYLIKNEDLYKIGITVSIERRMKELKPEKVLAVKECTNMRGIEKLLHKRYHQQRIPQTEYFRLKSSQVQEAIVLLSGEPSDGYEAAVQTIEDSKAIELMGKKIIKPVMSNAVRRQYEKLENMAKLLQYTFLWEEIKDNDGNPTTILEIFLAADPDDQDIKYPPSPQFLQACSRLYNKEDLFLSVAQSETESEALNEVHRVILDLSHAICFGYRNGVIQINDAGDGVESLIETLEAGLRDTANEWFTWKID